MCLSYFFLQERRESHDCGNIIIIIMCYGNITNNLLVAFFSPQEAEVFGDAATRFQ